MCMKVEACSESARCPHVRSSRYKALVCGNPYRTPHTDGELQVRGCCWSGYIVEKVLHPGQKLGLWMATVVRLQDGEGWTPRNVHQSILLLGTICYRPLASEQVTLSAIQRACVEYAGKEVLKGCSAGELLQSHR